MVVKVYISGISGNKEVKKRQQRVLMILDSKTVKYEVIDITEPGKEAVKDFMQNNAKSNGGTVSDPNPRSPLPPQLFNEEEYCGDYDQFDLANEIDTLEQFLKLEVPPEEPTPAVPEQENAVNGDTHKSKENSQEREATKEDDAKKDDDPEKENVKESSPEKDAASRETTPAKEESDDAKVETTKEPSPEKEKSPERQKSEDKEIAAPESKDKSPEKESEVKPASKENTPEKEESVNENGATSSREQSTEKETIVETDAIETKKDNSSELLIESERAAAE